MKPHGMALVEALVASALLGLGLLGATRLTTHALGAALQTRQQVQAEALAAQALDCAIARQTPCPAQTQSHYQGMTYIVRLQYTALDASLTDVQAQVQWASTVNTNPLKAAQVHSLLWRTRISNLPDWVGVSSP